jgi:hypothetical protein
MGNNRGRRRRFGALRELKSGQWQARYRGPDGLMRPADHTFPSKTDAEVWLTRKEAEILNGDWIDPDAGRVPFPDYAAGECLVTAAPCSAKRPLAWSFEWARLAGFEPATRCLEGSCSIRLSYRRLLNVLCRIQVTHRTHRLDTAVITSIGRAARVTAYGVAGGVPGAWRSA